jgi:hypothetical protein
MDIFQRFKCKKKARSNRTLLVGRTIGEPPRPHKQNSGYSQALAQGECNVPGIIYTRFTYVYSGYAVI